MAIASLHKMNASQQMSMRSTPVLSADKLSLNLESVEVVTANTDTMPATV